MNLLRTSDAAKRLGVSASYLEKRRHLGDGPEYVKLGRVVAYREDDLASWVQAHLRRNTSQADAQCAA